MPALAEAGFHVVAPDMRGFGRSSAPSDIAAYSIFDAVGDMVALVAALGEAKVAIVGHDWGAPVAWHAALFRPDLFTAVAGLSVPPPFRGRGRPLDTLRENGITNFYWQYFQPPGLAEAELERDVSLTLRTLGAVFPTQPLLCSLTQTRVFCATPPATGRCPPGSAKPISPSLLPPIGEPAFAAG
jgi:pimeloyl-ACP methyl ester carboxylesterase